MGTVMGGFVGRVSVVATTFFAGSGAGGGGSAWTVTEGAFLG